MDGANVKLTVTLTKPAVLKGEHPDARCPTCAGFGLKVRRKNRRRNGSLSSVVLDGNVPCAECGGSGRAVKA